MCTISAVYAAVRGYESLHSLVWARLFQDIEGGTDKLVAYIESLPKGRCITITTSDSAIAKSRTNSPRN